MKWKIESIEITKEGEVYLSGRDYEVLFLGAFDSEGFVLSHYFENKKKLAAKLDYRYPREEV